MTIAASVGWVISVWLWIRARQRSEAAVATAMFITLLTLAVTLRIEQIDVLITFGIGYGNLGRFATYVLGTIALYSLMIALKAVFQFSERDTRQIRYVSLSTVFVLLVTGPMTLVKVGATPDDISQWAPYGGLVFNLATLIYGFVVCAICVRQFGRLIITESYLHVRLRWVSISFAAFCGCSYTLGRLYVTYAMFGSIDTSHPLDPTIRIFLIAAFCGLGIFFLMGPLFKYGTRLWMHWIAVRQLRALDRILQTLDIQPIIDGAMMNDDKMQWGNIDSRLCQAVIAIMDAKHQPQTELASIEKAHVLDQLNEVDDTMSMMDLIVAYSHVGANMY